MKLSDIIPAFIKGVIVTAALIIILFGWRVALEYIPTDGSGTDEPTRTAELGKEAFFIQRCKITAYCPCEICCGEWATKGYNLKGQRVTATQHVIKPGDKFVAAPKGLPFGTRLAIPGYGDNITVEDRGGAITGYRLDVFFATHQGASDFGVKEDVPVKVFISRLEK